MENQKSNIDNALRDKFEDFAPPPPAHIWEGIEAGLAAQPKPVVATTIWKGIGIAASILLLIGFSFWWFMPKEDSGEIAEIPENTITTTESGDPGQEAITPSTAITDAEQADSENTADQQPDTELTDEHNSVIAEDQSDRKHDQNPNQPADNYGIADNSSTTNAGDTAPLSPTTTATIATIGKTAIILSCRARKII